MWLLVPLGIGVIFVAIKERKKDDVLAFALSVLGGVIIVFYLVAKAVG